MTADSTGTLATPSASSTARRIELTVESRFTIKPLRSPLDSAAPRAKNFTSSSSISAISAHVFMLPMSSPTTYLSFFAKCAPDLFQLCHGGCARVWIQHDLSSVLQINRLHAAIGGLPLRKIFDHHAKFPGEIALPEMNSHRLRIVGRGDTGDDGPQILGIRQIHFADPVGRTRAHQLHIFYKFLIGLHALTALLARHALGKAG